MSNFKGLKVWERGIAIAAKAYRVAKHLPKEELYGLRSQITRSAVSIPSNIAEGCSRVSGRDYARFLQIALGSAFELETELLIGAEMEFFPSGEVSELLVEIQEEQRMIQGLINKIKKSTSGV